MKSIIVLAAFAALAAGPALAWDNTQTGPGPKSIADAGGMSQAQQARSTAVSSAQGGAARARGGAGGNASQTVNVSGGGSGGGVAVPFNPPPIATGNPCAGGFSIGGFGVGGGGGGGGLWELHDCRLRAAAVLLDARGDHAAARNVWCQIDEVKEAYRLAGQPCPTEPPEQQTVHTVSSDGPPDYCFTASPGEVRQHRECRGIRR